MKNFIIYLFSFLLLFSFKYSFSQANLLNAKVPQEIGIPNEQQLEADDETPIAYGFVEDRDVMWSKTIWEKIDLDERINFPYYYPTVANGMLSENRKSLWRIIIDGIKSGEIKEIYNDDYFISSKDANTLRAMGVVQRKSYHLLLRLLLKVFHLN